MEDAIELLCDCAILRDFDLRNFDISMQQDKSKNYNSRHNNEDKELKFDFLDKIPYLVSWAAQRKAPSSFTWLLKI